MFKIYKYWRLQVYHFILLFFVKFLFQIRHQQDEIRLILEAHKIEFKEIDVSADEEAKQFMRAHSKPKGSSVVALPPQVFNENEYCGVCWFCTLFYLLLI